MIRPHLSGGICISRDFSETLLQHLDSFSSFSYDKAALIWRNLHFQRFFRPVISHTSSTSSEARVKIKIIVKSASLRSMYDFMQHVFAHLNLFLSSRQGTRPLLRSGN